MLISIVIPVFNEARTIRQVLNKVLKLPINKEIIVVDDGSTDGTVELLEAYHTRDLATIITHAINRGKGAALISALPFIHGDVTIIQDADLELNPNDIPKLLKPFEESAWVRVVFGNRFHGGGQKNIPGFFYNKFYNVLIYFLLGRFLYDAASGYKVLETRLLKMLDLRKHGFAIDAEIAAKLILYKEKIIEVPIDYHPRTKRQGKKLNYWRDGFFSAATIVKIKLVYLIEILFLFVTFPLKVLVPDHILKKLHILTFKEIRISEVLYFCSGRLLDVGCGENELVCMYGNGVGFDVFAWPGVDVVGDARSLPFEKESFDTVTFVASLNHIIRSDLALQEAYRILKPGGRILVTMITPLVGFVAHKIIWHDPDQYERGMVQGELYGLSQEHVCELLQGAGFKIKMIKSFYFGLNHLFIAEK